MSCPSARASRRRFLSMASCGSLWTVGFPGCATVTDPLRYGMQTRTPSPRTDGVKGVRQTIVIDRPGLYDFANVLHVWEGARWPTDREYGPAILHVRTSGVDVRNFAFAGAPDGVHVGALPWTPRNAIRWGAPVSDVRFDHLQATDIREDALTCQTNTSRVTLTDCHFWGGKDKAIQNDHATDLVIRRCGFYDGVRSIRFKAGTSGHVHQCAFLRCDYPIKADSRPWPDSGSSRRRRSGGPVALDITENTFFAAKLAISTDSGVAVRRARNRFPATDRETELTG